MKKILSLMLVLVLAVSLFAACGKTAPDTDEPSTEEPAVQSVSVNVGLLKGPTGMGCAHMWCNSENLENDYKFSLETDASVMGAKLISGEYDIAAMPSNAAAALYKKSQGKIRILAVNTLGVLHIMSENDDIKSVADLEGKTICASGQGTTAEYILNYVLEKNGLEVGKDVFVEYVTEHSEVVTKAVSGNADTVLLPEPFVTQLGIKSSEFRAVLDLSEEWGKISDNKLTMGVIAVNKAFADANPSVITEFINEYSDSVSFTNANQSEAAKEIEACDILTAAVAEKAVPNSNIVCITGEEMKSDLESFFTVLLESAPESIGGEMPDDGLYY